MIRHSISVRNLIEFVYSAGDIDNRYTSVLRAKDGIVAHQYVQKGYGAGAKAEVSVSYTDVFDDVELILSGRIDGLFIDTDNKVTIDEIKSTSRDIIELEAPSDIHLLQAKFYAFMYANENSVEQISVMITYINPLDKTTKIFTFTYDIPKLQKEVIDVILLYLDYLRKINFIKQNKDESINNLSFPFPFRKGQRNIVKNVYKTLTENKNLFLHAPTGSGKTLSVLFPSLKYIAGKNAKIFYLSSKGTQKNAAAEAVSILANNGLCVKTVIIDAKEKVCPNDKVSCNPEDCEYARGYYDKIKEIIYKLLQSNDMITREVISSYAEEHKVCPFELSLDISLFCDIIICDYNYCFDPIASLKRYFEESGEYIFLVDEAHNLSERGRGMYSADIKKDELLKSRKNIKIYKSLYSTLGKINTSLNKILKYDDKQITEIDSKDEVFASIRNFMNSTDKYAVQHGALPEQMQDIYLTILRFYKLMQLAGKSHIFYYDKAENALKLYCLDASAYLAESMKNSCSSILFSATLIPTDYFMRISGGQADDYVMVCDSPFDEANLKVIAACNIELTYKKRNDNISKIISYINAVIEHKKGNYIAFFPSIEFMNLVYDAYVKQYGEENLILQRSGMNEDERAEFISRFDDTESALCAFAVLGGSFAESIDLTGERLIGCIVVSVGLPKVCYEREKLKEYYDKEGNGFDYAYLYEGMNKIMQAGGRVIRTENDKGTLLLIDSRFNWGKYKALSQKTWPNTSYTYSYEEYTEALKG